MGYGVWEVWMGRFDAAGITNALLYSFYYPNLISKTFKPDIKRDSVR